MVNSYRYILEIETKSTIEHRSVIKTKTLLNIVFIIL